MKKVIFSKDAVELCPVYENKDNYQCRFGYIFDALDSPVAYTIKFDIEEKATQDIVCSYIYNPNTRQMHQIDPMQESK